MADGIGGYMLEVKPTEAADQGEWKCVATSLDGVVAISTCDVKMTSKQSDMIFVYITLEILTFFSPQTF